MVGEKFYILGGSGGQKLWYNDLHFFDTGKEKKRDKLNLLRITQQKRNKIFASSNTSNILILIYLLNHTSLFMSRTGASNSLLLLLLV